MIRKCRHRWELGCAGTLIRTCLECEKIEDCDKIPVNCEECGGSGYNDEDEVEELDFAE